MENLNLAPDVVYQKRRDNQKNSTTPSPSPLRRQEHRRLELGTQNRKNK